LLRRFATKNRAFSAVAAVSAVLLVAALFFIWREYTQAQSSLRGAVEARSIAEQQRNEAQAAHRLAEQALKRELLRNARRAAELVDRFCAETLRLPNPPMFNEPGPAPGHDAAEYLIPFSDYEPVDEDSPPHEGSRHLPRDLRDRVRGYGQDWLTKITDEDLNGLDFAWMQRLGEFDRWTAATVGFLHDLPPQLASAIPVPDYNGLQAWTKLRLADGLRKGDAAAASKELHHLADLIHSQGFILADLVASIILGMDHRARARAIELGQSVSGWPEFDPAQSGRYRRIMMSSFGYFLPEVSSEVAAKAIHCLPPGRLMEARRAWTSSRPPRPSGTANLRWSLESSHLRWRPDLSWRAQES
jgi:hypothetical protein